MITLSKFQRGMETGKYSLFYYNVGLSRQYFLN